MSDFQVDRALMHKIDELCYPESVAVIGASDNVLKWGSFLTVSLLSGQFAGPIYPINPKVNTVLGLPCYPNLAACPGPVDLVFITLPQPKVLSAIADCAANGVKNVVVITSGYSETGEKGKELERELVQAVRAGGMRMIGPNTMGMMSIHQSLCCTGTNAQPPKGSISMISQSGNLGAQVMMWAEEQNVGINKFFGTGNEGDLNCTDLLQYLAEDDSTSAVLLYMEGMEDGREFLKVARYTAERKPVVLLKCGRTEVGAKAAASHTGAMSGSHDIFKGAMRQAGVILVRQPMDLIDGAAGSYLPMPKNNRVCVLTLGGGWGVVASDLCHDFGLKLPPLPPEIVEKLDKMLPSFWSRQNPVDLVGQIDPMIFTDALAAVVSSDAYDVVITLGLIGSSNMVADTVKSAYRVAPQSVSKSMVEQVELVSTGLNKGILDDVVRLTEAYGKPIVNVSLDRRQPQTVITTDSGDHVVAFNTPEKAVLVMGGMAYYQAWRRTMGLPEL